MSSEELVMTGAGSQELWLQPEMISTFSRVAEFLSASTAMPDHIKNNVGNAMIITMQAASWKLNPVSVAQNSYILHGRMCYSAQLVNTIINTMSSLKHRLEYEFIGDWSKVLGRYAVQTGQNGGKYYTQDWSMQDEQGIGVIVRGQFKGEDKPREITVMLKQCQPRNSTQWATDPQQQITYAATQKFARRYCPDAIAGVYSDFDDTAEYRSSEQVSSSRPDVAEKIIQQAQQDDIVDAEVEEVKEPEQAPEQKPVKTEGVLNAGELKALAESLAGKLEESTDYASWKSTVDEIGDAGFTDGALLMKLKTRAQQIKRMRRYAQ